MTEPPDARETIRLAHFSDIHLTAKPLGWRLRDFLSKRATGWMNLKLGRGRRFRDAETITAAMMREIHDGHFNHIVFSGDATTLGFEAEFAVAARALEIDSLPGLAVPGNHDYYTRAPVKTGLFERFFAPWQHGERIDDAIYPFAQRVGHCWLIGVNSARANRLIWDARGLVGIEQLNRLRELLKRLGAGPRIVVTHYPLYLADGQPEKRWRRLRDWQAFCDIVVEGKIALWLHGHRHNSYVVPATPEQPFTVICAGSATQEGRWGWNEYAIERMRLTMTRRVWNGECFDVAEKREIETIA
jgi:3',5'-cyclic AMP phosphodiesterase CpdA